MVTMGPPVRVTRCPTGSSGDIGKWRWHADGVVVRSATTGLTDGPEPVVGKTSAPRCGKQGMFTDQSRPHASPAPCRSPGPPLDVVEWRWCRLREAGFPVALARSLSRKHVDLHALLELVDAG